MRTKELTNKRVSLQMLAVCANALRLVSAHERVWKSEQSNYRDNVTGAEVWRLTANPEVEIIPDRIKDPWSPDGSQYYTVGAREHSGRTSPYSRISNAVVTNAGSGNATTSLRHWDEWKG